MFLFLFLGLVGLQGVCLNIPLMRALFNFWKMKFTKCRVSGFAAVDSTVFCIRIRQGEYSTSLQLLCWTMFLQIWWSRERFMILSVVFHFLFLFPHLFFFVFTSSPFAGSQPDMLHANWNLHTPFFFSFYFLAQIDQKWSSSYCVRKITCAKK